MSESEPIPTEFVYSKHVDLSFDELLEKDDILALNNFIIANPECHRPEFFIEACQNPLLIFKHSWILTLLSIRIKIIDYHNSEVFELINNLLINDRLFALEICLKKLNEMLLADQRVFVLKHLSELIFNKKILSTSDGKFVENCCKLIITSGLTFIPVNSENGLMLKLAIRLNMYDTVEILLANKLIRFHSELDWICDKKFRLAFKYIELKKAFDYDNLTMGKLIMKKLLEQNPKIEVESILPVPKLVDLQSYEEYALDNFFEGLLNFLILCKEC